MKHQSSKLWEVKSDSIEDIFWVHARTKPEAKKILRYYFRSKEYWGGEPNLELATTFFKSYTSYKDIPGLQVDDTRGDVIVELTDPSQDWIWQESE